MSLHKCPECGEGILNSIGSWTICDCGHGFEATEETEVGWANTYEDV